MPPGMQQSVRIPKTPPAAGPQRIGPASGGHSLRSPNFAQSASTRRAVPNLSFPLGGGREGVPDPVDRLADKPGVAVLALDLQITLPGSFAVGALDQRTHEGEVANV